MSASEPAPADRVKVNVDVGFDTSSSLGSHVPS